MQPICSGGGYAEGLCKSHANLFSSSVLSCFIVGGGCTSGSVLCGVDVGADYMSRARC